MIAFISSSEKNLAIGEVIAPSSAIFMYAIPFAPKYLLAYSSYSPRTFLENFSKAFGAVIHFTIPPLSATSLNALNPQFLTISVKSFSSTPNLTSGLSEPNLAIASA